MKEFDGGMKTQNEDKDYEHKSFSEILSGMNESNARRRESNKPAVVYVAQCLICPEQPKFTSLELAQEHDKKNINKHRTLNGVEK